MFRNAAARRPLLRSPGNCAKSGADFRFYVPKAEEANAVSMNFKHLRALRSTITGKRSIRFCEDPE
jgi:hypothetical protein